MILVIMKWNVPNIVQNSINCKINKRTQRSEQRSEPQCGNRPAEN